MSAIPVSGSNNISFRRIEPQKSTAHSRVDFLAKEIIISPFFWAALLGLTATGSVVLFSLGSLASTTFIILLTGSVAGVVGIKVAYPKDLHYEATIVFLFARQLMGSPWWHKINNDIYLGGVPLQSSGHLEELKALGISTVISCFEEFEGRKITFFSRPVTPEDWMVENIRQHFFETVDLTPLSMEQLNWIADLIYNEIHAGKKIYVHCAAGRGRSVMAVSAYFMKYQNMSFEQSQALVSSIRPTWINSRQKAVLETFQSMLNPQAQNIA